MKRFIFLLSLSIVVSWIFLGMFINFTVAMDLSDPAVNPQSFDANEVTISHITHVPTLTNQFPFTITWETLVPDWDETTLISTSLFYRHDQVEWTMAPILPSTAVNISDSFIFTPSNGDGLYAFSTVVYTAAVPYTTTSILPPYTGITTTTFDITPPTAKLTSPAHVSATQILLEWEIDDNYAGVLSYTIEYSATYMESWQVLSTNTKPKTIVISHPFTAKTDTWYTFHVTAQDGLGNITDPPIIQKLYVGPFNIYLPLAAKNYTNAQIIPFKNGDFENGQLHPWVGIGDLVPANLQSPGDSVINGEGYSVLIGNPAASGQGDAPIGNGRISQTFSIPLSDVASILTIQYHIYSQDVVRGALTNDYLDTFEIHINKFSSDQANQPSVNDEARLARCITNLGQPAAPTDPVYTEGGLIFCDGRKNTTDLEDLGPKAVTLDLSAYKGEVITLYLASFSRWDDWDNTYTYIDNIQASWQQ